MNKKIPPSPHSNTGFVAFLTICIALSIVTYAFILEKKTIHKAHDDTEHYSNILANQLWDLNNEAASEYIQIISEEGVFASIRVNHSDGSPFVSATSPSKNYPFSEFLRSLNALRNIATTRPIIYKNKEIGSISTVRENTNIYLYLILSIAGILATSIISLIRVARQKRQIYHKVESDLTINKEHLHSVIHSSPVITFSLDSKGHVTRCDGMGLNKLTIKTVIGRTINSLQKHFPCTVADFRHAIKGYSFSAIRTADKRTFETWYSPSLENGKVTGVFGVATDITAAVQAMNSLDEFKLEQIKINELARLTHTALLPNKAPDLDEYEIGFACCLSEQTGGDYVHFLKKEQQQTLDMTFAEMSGQGASTVMLASIFASRLSRQLSQQSQSLLKTFYTLNSELHEHFPDNSFASTFHASLDAKSHNLKFIKASREPALLFPHHGKSKALEEGGPALGLFPSSLLNTTSYIEQDIQLEPGDSFMLYTDGLISTLQKEDRPISREELMNMVSDLTHMPPQELADTLMQKALNTPKNQDIQDDISILIIRRK